MRRAIRKIDCRKKMKEEKNIQNRERTKRLEAQTE
jgi:hypothetical protein